MAGEIEEPFTFDFRVDSFDSGSISFGRFESEGVCWERRSSFLHNRYLEEVEKCSKPGSVTEKKAYFEAHFRKKGFPVLTSLECPDDKFSRQELSEIGHMNSSAQSDQSLDGLDNNKLLTECETRVDKADDHIELGTTLAISSESVIQMKENLDCETAYSDPNEGVQTSLSKKNSASKPDHIKPRLVPRVSPGSSRRCTPVVTSKAAKKTSGDPQKHRLLHKTTKYDQGASETKGVDSAAGREVRSRSRSIVEPQKVSGRAIQSANRVKPAVGVSKSGTRQDTSKSTKKEAVPSNIQPGKPHAGTSVPGTRLSKSSQSKVDRITSTESSASSSARTSKVKASQTRISRKKEPEKEKLTSVPDGKEKMRIERH
ncbi:hypothetical protein ACS0TY_008457 [Phlomoides rotata]